MFFCKVNDSMIISDNMNLGDKSVSTYLAKMVSAETLRKAFKTVGKNSKNTSSKIYISRISELSIIYKCNMNCMRGFLDLNEQRQLHYKPVCQKDTKAGRSLSSRSTWDKSNLGPGLVRMVIS